MTRGAPVIVLALLTIAVVADIGHGAGWWTLQGFGWTLVALLMALVDKYLSPAIERRRKLRSGRRHAEEMEREWPKH